MGWTWYTGGKEVTMFTEVLKKLGFEIDSSNFGILGDLEIDNNDGEVFLFEDSVGFIRNEDELYTLYNIITRSH